MKLEDSIKGFKSIVEGECDDVPENAFYMGEHWTKHLRKLNRFRNGKPDTSGNSNAAKFFSDDVISLTAPY
jgi:hypothetical protein